MKIAQIAPLYESVPPKYYGGTERVVSYLTEELVRMGHDVTLYASGDSVTAARLKSLCHRALRLDKYSIDPVADHIFLAERVFQDQSEFDIIHSHIDYLPFPIFRRLQTPHITTLHGCMFSGEQILRKHWYWQKKQGNWRRRMAMCLTLLV